MANVKIYQLRLQEGVPFPDWTFRDWETAQSLGFDPQAYELVYEYEEPSGNLEKVFEIFNIAHPADYCGRSLSVSDVVVMDGTPYYVDSFGFVELPATSFC